MTRRRSDRLVGPPLTVPIDVIDAALRTAGRALSHPVSSAEFNRALRASGDHESLRRALGELASRPHWTDWGAVADPLIDVLQAGEAAGGRVRPGVRQQQRSELSLHVYVLFGLTTLLHLEAAQLEWWRAWPPGCDYLPDDEEQALFERWKGERLRRRIWPSLPVDERVLLLRPVFELVYLYGAYRALRRRNKRWPLWRFRKGAGCRRHDALDGLCAPGDAPVWKTALPPLAYFCDCFIEPVAASAQVAAQPAAMPSPCPLFAFDKRKRGAEPFLREYLARMRAECDEDDADCGGPAKTAPVQGVP